MKTAMVKVPRPLLLDRDLADSAKLLWMILQLGAHSDQAAISTRLLEAQSGLTRHTVRRGLTGLESAGWLPARPKGHHTSLPGWAALPHELLLDSQLGAQAKVLYACIQLTAHFRDATGELTYGELSYLTGKSTNTVKYAVRALQDRGWLQLAQKNKYSPIHFALRNPVTQRHEDEVYAAGRRLEKAPYFGEALMREYLSLIVDSEEYEDNATPGFLVNPFTGEEMQYDRYYPPRVAFEFNGPQHYGPTARYPNEVDTRKQQGRDYIKHGISSARGIRLVVLHPADLGVKVMRQKVDSLLPLRQLNDHEPLIAYLESISRAYRRKARQHR